VQSHKVGSNTYNQILPHQYFRSKHGRKRFFNAHGHGSLFPYFKFTAYFCYVLAFTEVPKRAILQLAEQAKDIARFQNSNRRRRSDRGAAEGQGYLTIFASHQK
jgi:hypothetical protein